MVRIRVGTFNLISDEIGRRSIRECLQSNQCFKIESNAQYWWKSNTTRGQVMCLRCHSENLDVTSRLQNRKLLRTERMLMVLSADFAREKSRWRHKVAQGPRAKLWSPNLGVSGGQVWEMHGHDQRP